MPSGSALEFQRGSDPDCHNPETTKRMTAQPTHTPPTNLDIVILAAGLGTRMKSRVAKVLHELQGRPIIAHVCHTASLLEPRRTYVIVGHQAEDVQAAVEKELGKDQVSFNKQTEQRGTGDAVMCARDSLAEGSSTALILSGDVPLVRSETLQGLIRAHIDSKASCTMLSVRLENLRVTDASCAMSTAAFLKSSSKKMRPRTNDSFGK